MAVHEIFNRDVTVGEATDVVDLRGGSNRVEPRGAAVFPLAANADASGNEAELYVAAKRRLRQRDATGAEEFEDRLARRALGVFAVKVAARFRGDETKGRF